MNNYVRKLFGIMFQSKQTRQSIRIQSQHLPTSPDEWRQHWQARGLLWRTEPEIDEKRQRELSQRLAIMPDIKQGIYPFKGMKLSRADVEWLLVTHEDGRGPVDVSDPLQQDRKGIDLRGANLRRVDLRSLPLACMYSGLDWDEWRQTTTVEQREVAAIHLEGANLRGVHLERARLRRAHLEGASLRMAHLEGAPLFQARLEGADLFKAHLEGANLREAHLEGREVPTDDAELMSQWKNHAVWAPADMRLAFFDQVTSLDTIILGNEKHGWISLADVKWGGTNLSVIDWASVKMLGDECNARQRRTSAGKKKQRDEQLNEYQAALRANRQLSIALEDQGLNNVAAHFAYRAQILERKLFWKQRDFGRWCFSLLLAVLAGYGYRIWRIFVAYGLLICLFAAIYYFNLGSDNLTWYQQVYRALVVSFTAFHGRTYTGQYGPDTALGGVAALEGIFGLVIEGVFIAMLVQRFFGK